MELNRNSLAAYSVLQVPSLVSFGTWFQLDQSFRAVPRIYKFNNSILVNLPLVFYSALTDPPQSQ